MLCFYDQSLKYTKKNGLQREVVILVLELAVGGELFDFMMYTGAFPEVVARTYFLQVRSHLVKQVPGNSTVVCRNASDAFQTTRYRPTIWSLWRY